jgi:hypothetical protein
MPPVAPRDNRSRFPHGFRNNQAKPLAQRLLNDDLRQSLEGVDFDISNAHEVREYMNSRILLRALHDLGIDLQPSGSSNAMEPIMASCKRGKSFRSIS